MKNIFKLLHLGPQTLTRFNITLLVFFSVSFVYAQGWIQRYELVTYDARCILKGARPTDPRILSVQISDDSLAKIGFWPWTRDWHASMIRALTDLGAKAIIFDVLFLEKSDPVNDQMLSQAIKESGRVYLAEAFEQIHVKEKTRRLLSIPIFTEYAKGIGHINTEPDMDGTMRRVPLFLEAGGKKDMQLSLAFFLAENGLNAADLIFKPRRVEIPLKDQTVTVPLDDQGQVILDWGGKWKQTFRHYSYIDVLSSYALMKKGKKPIVDLEPFKGAICYIGTTATGLFDIRPTPLEPSYPAMGVNMTLLDNLLSRQFVRDISFTANCYLLALLSILFFFGVKTSHYFKIAALMVLFIFCYVALAFLVFIIWKLWINMIYGVLVILFDFFFVTFYDQIYISMERSKLMKLATRDSMTGLFNVGHFKLMLKAEMATLAIRHDRPLSLVMSDVDHFKNVNDTYGHQTGDVVLREVAQHIRTSCRALDVAARYGGEEFILMLPGANVDEAHKVAEKIRNAFQNRVFPHEKGDFKVTISLGVTQVKTTDRSIEDAIERADKALYQAKNTGRNKTIIGL